MGQDGAIDKTVWRINYDQLEPIIKEYMKTHVYMPAEVRKKKGIAITQRFTLKHKEKRR